jgi:hypothetical protein
LRNGVTGEGHYNNTAKPDLVEQFIVKVGMLEAA